MYCSDPRRTAGSRWPSAPPHPPGRICSSPHFPRGGISGRRFGIPRAKPEAKDSKKVGSLMAPPHHSRSRVRRWPPPKPPPASVVNPPKNSLSSKRTPDRWRPGGQDVVVRCPFDRPIVPGIAGPAVGVPEGGPGRAEWSGPAAGSSPPPRVRVARGRRAPRRPLQVPGVPAGSCPGSRGEEAQGVPPGDPGGPSVPPSSGMVLAFPWTLRREGDPPVPASPPPSSREKALNWFWVRRMAPRMSVGEVELPVPDPGRHPRAVVRSSQRQPCLPGETVFSNPLLKSRGYCRRPGRAASPIP